MARKKETRASKLARALITQHGRWAGSEGISWSAAYTIEDLFGVDEKSAFKTLEDAIRNASNAPHPSPVVKYDFEKHALIVQNCGCLLGRFVTLQKLPGDGK